jgi:predicted RNA-binding Zn ribbon-like protein
MSSSFLFTSGRLCLWLVATVGNRGSQPYERLRTCDDLSRWCVEAKLLETLPDVTENDLNSARMLREAIYQVALALREKNIPEARELETINSWAAQPSLVPQLGRDGRTCSWIAQNPIEAALAMIARDAVTLLGSSDVDRLKLCAQPICAMLFLDTSRSGQRRWCSMNVCGNREKKANYRRLK